MKELLPDNVTVGEDPPSRFPEQRPKQREITSVLTWVSAFTTYIAILSEAHPNRTKDLLAYMRLIVREARRSNRGWLSYDRIFRQNAAANPSISWANLDPSLHSSFCIGSEAPPTLCAHCNELDHMSEECAIAKNMGDSAKPPDMGPSQATRPFRTLKKAPTKKICLSWNSGKCMLPGTCEYHHECATCHAAHRARDCELTPADSVFKRPQKRPRVTN